MQQNCSTLLTPSVLYVFLWNRNFVSTADSTQRILFLKLLLGLVHNVAANVAQRYSSKRPRMRTLSHILLAFILPAAWITATMNLSTQICQSAVCCGGQKEPIQWPNWINLGFEEAVRLQLPLCLCILYWNRDLIIGHPRITHPFCRHQNLWLSRNVTAQGREGSLWACTGRTTLCTL